ncbi:MAG: SAM-dependent methyltransferase [Oscillospiraceae bacterium]|nr:SAM-dependent methyltransferase [Oscillospiraceae bacterium]
MKLPISDRLLACAGFVSPGSRIADVGCDHGYLSIHLLTNGIAQSCIASDINEQPLLSAVRNAEKYGVRDKMEFYISDGVRNIPRDFDTLICAGMGADTMVSILEAAPWLKSEQYRLILQCQSKTPTLRRYLSNNGWRITEESVLRDGKFLYTVMEVYYEPDYPRLTDGELYFPPALLENPSKEVPAYFHWVTEGLRIATAHKEDPEKHQALAQLEALAQNENLSFLTEDIT